MADSTEKKIFQALATAANAVSLPSGWTMVLPGVTFAPTAGSKYVSAEVHFNRPIRTDLSFQIDPIRQGFLRLNVMLPKTHAEVDAVDLCGQLLSHFKAGTKLYRDSIQVRIDDDPIPPVRVGGDTHINHSLTINWICYPQVPA